MSDWISNVGNFLKQALTTPHNSFIVFSLGALGLQFLYNRYIRKSRFYAIFASAFLGMHFLFYLFSFYFYLPQCTSFSSPRFLFPYLPIYYCQTMLLISLLRTSKMRPLWYKSLVTWPGYMFVGATTFGLFTTPFLHLFKLLSQFIPFDSSIPFPYIIPLTATTAAAVGMVQSLFNRYGTGNEVVHVPLNTTSQPFDSLEDKSSTGYTLPKRIKTVTTIGYEDTISKQIYPSKKTLRVFQLTDTHLGPFMSETRMKTICQKIVTLNPDLVVITGDLETMESHSNPEALINSFAPLKQLKGKVFACLGNHDYERHRGIVDTLLQHDIIVMEDEHCFVQIKNVGNVELIGSVYNFGRIEDKRQHMERLMDKFPKNSQSDVRLLLLHNPSDGLFIRAKDEIDMVFCGHYHSGQIAFPFTGLTILRLFSILRMFKIERGDWRPDYGLFEIPNTRTRLYAHRGTGHYGFPLRFGMFNEESILKIYI